MNPDDDTDIGIRRTVRYRVRRSDDARRRYLCLGMAKRKPHVIASARLLRVCELTAMSAIPGVSLGVNLAMEHTAPAVRGSVLTVDAACTKRRGRYWEWDVEVRNVEKKVIARCTLGFIADVNGKCYTARRLVPQFAARTIGVRVWLLILDALGLITVMAIPVQVAYVWHGLVAMVAIETALALGWLISLTGLPFAIGDRITIRQVKDKDPAQLESIGDKQHGTDAPK